MNLQPSMELKTGTQRSYYEEELVSSDGIDRSRETQYLLLSIDKNLKTINHSLEKLSFMNREIQRNSTKKKGAFIRL